MSTQDLHHLGVAGLGQALAAKTVSSVEITQHLLSRAQAHAHLGSFLHLDAEAALNAARVRSAWAS